MVDALSFSVALSINLSDVYRRVNCIGSLAKFKRTPMGLIHFACDPM